MSSFLRRRLVGLHVARTCDGGAEFCSIVLCVGGCLLQLLRWYHLAVARLARLTRVARVAWVVRMWMLQKVELHISALDSVVCVLTVVGACCNCVNGITGRYNDESAMPRAQLVEID
eukprot:4886695-Prymnesium_polylepis.1